MEAIRCSWRKQRGSYKATEYGTGSPAAYWFGASATLVGGSLYVFGGAGGAADVFDLTLTSWRRLRLEKGTLPRMKFHKAALVNSKIYLYCSRVRFSKCDLLYSFDIVTNEMTIVSSYGTSSGPVQGPSLSLWEHTDKVVLFGGYRTCTEWTYENTLLFILDISTMMWHPRHAKGEQPGKRQNHCACILNNTFYLYGGVNEGVQCYDMNILDLLHTHSTWRQVKIQGSTPNARCSATVTPIDGLLYIFGGYSGTSATNDTLIFDPTTRKWLSKNSDYIISGSAPSEREGHAAVCTLNTMIIFGGSTDDHGCVYELKIKSSS